MPAFLDHADPRLGLRATQAGLNDMMTRAAIRLLGDTLGQMPSGVIAAPSLGLPVRVMAVKEGDTIRYFLNPQIESCGEVDLVIAETTPHTGPIKRNVLRAKTIVLHGTDLSGAPYSAALEAAHAVQAQRGFDVMDQPAPFEWLTPFHHAILREQDAARRGLYLGLNSGLYAARRPSLNADLVGLHFASYNSINVHPDTGGRAIAQIDGLNPMRPTQSRHRAQLSLMAALPAGRNAMFSSASQLDLAVAACLLFPGLTAHVAEPNLWPQVSVDQMGLTTVLRRAMFEIIDFPEPPSDTASLDTIVMDTALEGGGGPDQSSLRRMSRALSGAAGAVIISTGAADPQIEDNLQAVFPALFAIEAASDHLMYLALKTPLEVAQARGRVVMQANVTGLSDMPQLLRARWLSLRKDGQRVPL